MDPRTQALSVRAAIARAWLGAEAFAPDIRLGEISLRPHQAAGVARLRAALAEYGGALLADETGLGKTYIAAALIAEAKHSLVVAPAALLPMWRSALVQAGTTAALHSAEALSRGRMPPSDRADLAERADLLIVVDEAHHFRNPRTRRYAALAELTVGARVLLLSATPVHNARADLTALLALFRTNPPHGRVIVRREHTAETRPRVNPIQWIETVDDEATLHDILALPPPVPPSDGEAGGALVAHGLVRQWASSTGALKAALQRRLQRAVAMTASLSHDRHPSYRDLRSWCLGDGSVQLAFPELLIPEAVANARHLHEAVDTHAQAVRRLLAAIESRPNPDVARSEALRQIVRGGKTLAFSAYEDTVRALARHMTRGTRVVALAGGRSRRADMLASFASGAIDLLLATDLLSEGLNLQAASAVVHVDLPWTPARMEQRVGRAARLGSPHPCVRVYALAPPASSEAILGVERRLREKLQHAARAVGVNLLLFPQPVAIDLRATMERWAAVDMESVATGAVLARRSGFLAAVRVHTETLLVADIGAGVTAEAEHIARAMRYADGEGIAIDPSAAAGAERTIREWAARRAAAADAGGPVAVHGRRLAVRIARIVHKARAHERPAVAAMAARARRAAAADFGAGASRALGALVEADLPDEAWLAALADFADAHERDPLERDAPRDGIAIIAMLLFQP